VKRLRTSFPGCDVLEAEAGAAGVAAYQSQQIDCVVAELLLPDMSIFDVIAEFLSLARYPGIAVIVLSPQPSPPMRQLVLSGGAQVLLSTSQISGDELEKTIEKALAALR
jgi:DNA-binding NarL/FixJ family response regulator